MTISVLITRAQQGNKSAQQKLFDLLHDEMMCLCRSYVKNAEDAEECLSDGFCRFFNALLEYEHLSDAAFYGWIRRIMINECLRLLSRKNSFIIVPDNELAAIALEEEALDKLSVAEIFKLIVRLPVGYRAVFNLHVIEGIDHKEIASIVGITEGTSKSQLSRAKSLLQKMLISNQEYHAQQRSK